VAEGLRAGVGLLENLLFGTVTVLSFVFALAQFYRAGSGWRDLGYLVPFWLVMAYLALPRFHRTMTRLYVPDYFIGRTRTQEGLLGDPVNLAFNGSQEQVHAAMTAAGWTLAEPVTLRSSIRIITSTLTRRSYSTAPVSPLVLFGRTQTLAYQQEVDGNPARRHHVRLWRCPSGWRLPSGSAVDWVAAGTYDRAVGLSIFTFQITHKIEENVDTERDHVVESVRAAVPAADVHVIENFSTGYHSRNGGGDAIYTDGNLPVVDVGGVDCGSCADLVRASAGVLPGETEDFGRTRPIAITGATAFVVITAATTLWSALLQLRGPGGWATGVSGATWVYVVWAVALHAALIWMAWRMYRGSGWARLVLLGVVTATQVTQMLPVITDLVITAGTILSTGAGLLALYGLTSIPAREWTARAGAHRPGGRGTEAAGEDIVVPTE